MTDLESVKLPLKLAQSSGIAKDAFKGCTNQAFTTIEFDFTTPTSNNLSDLGTDAITALTNIYKMFAGGDNSFGDNGDGVIQTPTSANF